MSFLRKKERVSPIFLRPILLPRLLAAVAFGFGAPS